MRYPSTVYVTDQRYPISLGYFYFTEIHGKRLKVQVHKLITARRNKAGVDLPDIAKVKVLRTKRGTYLGLFDVELSKIEII